MKEQRFAYHGAEEQLLDDTETEKKMEKGKKNIVVYITLYTTHIYYSF
jgi:hypothetical protein